MAPSLKVRAMLTISYGCGLRVGEVTRLTAGDIDSAQKIIRVVQGKGRKDRNAMLPPDVLAPLKAWWPERPKWHDAEMAPNARWLFPGYGIDRPITPRQYSRRFQEAVAAAGIKKPGLTLHTSCRRRAPPRRGTASRRIFWSRGPIFALPRRCSAITTC